MLSRDCSSPGSLFLKGGGLCGLVKQRAHGIPQEVALRYLRDGEHDEVVATWSSLEQGAMKVAGALRKQGQSGKPVLLTEAPGPEFVHGLLGIWMAGAVAVPAYPPKGRRHRERFEAIVRDSGASLCVGPCEGDGIERVILLEDRASDLSLPDADAPCLIQYTSGSTAVPKGVVISHRAMAAQLEAFEKQAKGVTLSPILTWLPPYHDMGLVLKVLRALHVGATLIWMAPEHFLQRPSRWLKAIDRYRVVMSGGPNFAFEWALRAVTDDELAELDLSCWKFAPTGAERVRRDTLERFRKRFELCGFDGKAFCPGYGLAEATLVVTSGPVDSSRMWRLSRKDPSQVSCGPPLSGCEVRVVDSTTRVVIEDEVIGEIEVASPSLAEGYWNRQEETRSTFVEGWLRTGDRGYVEDGELYVVGRIKDLMVLDGINYAPEDLESAAMELEPRIHACAAFAVDEGGGERVVLAIEVRDEDCLEERRLTESLAVRLAAELGVRISEVRRVRPGMLPRTTSGKIRRHAVREQYEPQPRVEVTVGEGELLEILMEVVREITCRDGTRPADSPLEIGLSSIDVTRLCAKLRGKTGVSLTHADWFLAPDFQTIARRMSEGETAGVFEDIPVGSGWSSGKLSHSQERMVFLHQLDPASAAYHVLGALDLFGPLDRSALERACERLVKDHAVLRSVHDGKGFHRVEERLRLELLSGEAEQVLRDFARRPFDLVVGLPVRMGLMACGPEHHLLVLCAHHVAIDGWSIRILVRELAAHYGAYRSLSPELPVPDGPDFMDYAAWQRRRLEAGVADEQIAFWKRHLEGHSGQMELPLDAPRPSRVTSDGGAVVRQFPAEWDARMEHLARSYRVTPFMIRFAVWMMWLRAHGAGDDLVSAVPVANRHHAISGRLVGSLVNTLPLRLKVCGDETFESLLQRVRGICFDLQANQEAPFEKIIEAVKPERRRDRAPIAQVMFDHQELPLPMEWSGGLRVAPRMMHRGAVQFELSLVSFRLPDRTELVMEYRSDLFHRERVERMLDRYLVMLGEVLERPGLRVNAYSVMVQDDRRELGQSGEGMIRPEWRERLTLLRIAEVIQRNPERIAVRGRGGAWTYRELGTRSSALASALRRQGVAAGDRVAVMLERTIDLPVALLAVWKCGAAYVPLDAAQPVERLLGILEDQGGVRVLVSRGLRGKLPDSASVLILEDLFFEGISDGDVASTVDQAAYLLYTSGSTGKPKGVVVPHGALANFLASMEHSPGFREGETLLAVTTVAFDISGLELFLPLVAGGTVDIVENDIVRDPEALTRRMRETDPEVMQATPALWRMLLDAGWEGSTKLRIFCGGEALDVSLAQKLRSRSAELWNLYGPTETTIWSTLWKVPEAVKSIRIGRPIGNTTVRVMSSDFREVPPGVTGELWIGGAGLALGYWQREALTAERFVEWEGHRYYRTGDFAKVDGEGVLECLGRNDSQVKIRGFRVELGEVDAAVLSHPQVEEAACVWVEERLIAWYRSGEGLESDALLRHLRMRLPDYMLPSRCVPLEVFPLNASGKMDRKALKSREVPNISTMNVVVCHDPLVQELRQIWAEVLGVKSVGANDDFFALGGHSLLAARLAMEAARRTGLRVPLDWLFDRPSPEGMALRLRESAGEDLRRPRAIPLAEGKGGRPLFWVHTLVDGGMGLLPYRETARMLGDVTDSYGIAEGDAGFERLEDLAAAHVSSIRKVQAHGPYRLAGFCFGGNVAAEIAWQLVQAGEEVELLILLEASLPERAVCPRWWLMPQIWMRMVSRLPGRLMSLVSRDFATIARRLRMKRRAVSERMRGERGIPDLGAVLDLEVLDEATRERALKHWKALHRHEARLPVVKRLVLIRAYDEGWLPRQEDLGWDAPVPMEIYTVSGRHEEFLRHHSAREVATVLRGVISIREDPG